MQALTNFFANLSSADPALWFGAATGLIVILLLVSLNRRPARARTTPAANTYVVDPLKEKAALDWFPASLRSDERRRSTRRGGLPTPIFVLDTKSGRRSLEAYVLDRSSGGIRFACQKPYPAGTILQVLPQNAPENTDWVAVQVRSCCEVGDYYELGCQFDQELPWNVLLLFG